MVVITQSLTCWLLASFCASWTGPRNSPSTSVPVSRPLASTALPSSVVRQRPMPSKLP